MQIDDMETYQSQPLNPPMYTSEIEKYNPNIGKLPEMRKKIVYFVKNQHI